MYVIIAGGGEVGYTIAQKLTAENHDITMIEANPNIVRLLSTQLDARILAGSGSDVHILREAGIGNAHLFMAVTNNDEVNIIACAMARKLNPNLLMTICKVEESSCHFGDPEIQPVDFGIDLVINPQEAALEKVATLIDHPEALELKQYLDGRIVLVGIRIEDHFSFCDIPLINLTGKSDLFRKIRIVAINRNEQLIIPRGQDVILPRDKLYFIGPAEIVQKVLNDFFDPVERLRSIVVAGASKIGKRLAKHFSTRKQEVTLIDSSLERCRKVSEEIDDILVLHGSATDSSVLGELDMTNACFISVSEDDEFNMISAIYAKQQMAQKSICMIRNIDLVPIVNTMTAIDAVFSPDVLTVGAIMRYCRRDNITSVTAFSEINAETVVIHIDEALPIVDKPLRDIPFPEGMIIGVIIRGDEVIVPTGNNKILLGDRLLIFIVEEALNAMEKLFSRKFAWISR